MVPISRRVSLPHVRQHVRQHGRQHGRQHARQQALLAVLLVSLAAPAGGQSFVVGERSSSAPHARGAASRRLVAGERSRYELRLGAREVGTGSLELVGEERIDGHATVHAVLQVSGRVLFARVEDRFDSWMDADLFFSRRFVQDQRELTSRRHKDYAMSPEQRTFTETDRGDRSALGSAEPLDDVSFLYYARSMPLRVGDVDTLARYFKPGHDVILRVLRRERVTVPAGTFETIVVQPTITNVGGLFGQGGQAEVYFSDDAARTIVQIRTRVPVVGSLSLHLTEYRAGH
jgi:hypothetical protein